MRKIGEFEMIDHGIEHSQYFQGCGVYGIDYNYVVTGIGNNPAEAIDDCLEQMAQAGFDTDGMEARIIKQEGWGTFSQISAGLQLPTTPDVQTECGDDCEELYYHVSIRWNPEETPCAT